MKYCTGSIIFAVLAILSAFFWSEHIKAGSGLTAIFIVLVLSVLEISLSFDNAVINAAKLEKMTPKWQQRFLTWGILIAVFGMRFVFPILIVSIFAHIDFLSVINIALNDADKYAHYLHISHPFVITFGGAFLMMLFLTYFFNSEKEIHWIKPIESKMAYLSNFRGLNTAIVLILIYLTQHFAFQENRLEIVISGIFGIITYILIDGFANLLEKHSEKREENCNLPNLSLKNSCLINFLYLELIDASFSLDGVLGAFALSKDIVVIALGLSIGAMFVRSMTIMLVQKKTLNEYIYLEQGAHWAIGALALIMFASANWHISEIITGLIGLIFILSAFISSVRENKLKK